MTPQAKTYYKDYYGQLIGAKITGFEFTEEDEMGITFPSLLATTPKGETISLQISMDEEGNGPGFIFIEPDGR